MKLLFDQNISYKLVLALAEVYPQLTHVRMVGLEFSDDETVWNYARKNNAIIVSKDADFHQRSFLFGFPPKVIWIRKGNCSTRDIEDLLRLHRGHIRKFSKDKKASYLIIS